MQRRNALLQERVSRTLMTTCGRGAGVQLIDITKHRELVYNAGTNEQTESMVSMLLQVSGLRYDEMLNAVIGKKKHATYDILVPFRLLHQLWKQQEAEFEDLSNMFSTQHMSEVEAVLRCRVQFLKTGTVPSIEQTIEQRLFGKALSTDPLKLWEGMLQSLNKMREASSTAPTSSNMRLRGRKRMRSSEHGLGMGKKKLKYTQKWQKPCATQRDASSLETYDRTRSERLKYRRGNEVMQLELRSGLVFMNCTPLVQTIGKFVRTTKVEAGPFGDIGVTSTARHRSPIAREALDEVIRDINDGFTQPAKWLLSHALSGRLVASNDTDCTASWFRKSSPKGQRASQSIQIKKIVKVLGPLVIDSEGAWLLPVKSGDLVCKLEKYDHDHELMKAVWTTAKGRKILGEVTEEEVEKLYLR